MKQINKNVLSSTIAFSNANEFLEAAHTLFQPANHLILPALIDASLALELYMKAILIYHAGNRKIVSNDRKTVREDEILIEKTHKLNELFHMLPIPAKEYLTMKIKENELEKFFEKENEVFVAERYWHEKFDGYESEHCLSDFWNIGRVLKTYFEHFCMNESQIEEAQKDYIRNPEV